MWDLKCTERDDEIGKSSKASIESRKSIMTEQAMLTVIVLITLPTNIVIIFVRIILMWNNNDEDYDHVDAGNQERAELGKEVFNTDTRSNFRLNGHFFFIWLWIVSTINVGVYIKSPPKFQNRLILEHWCICISDLTWTSCPCKIMTILSHTEKELIICLYTMKINDVVTFEIFEMHSRIFIFCRAPRWNPVRTINLRLNFTWFKKF